MEDKMTAVDWLFRNLWDQPKDKLIWWSILNNAKTLEMEQMQSSYSEGLKRSSYCRWLMDGDELPDDYPIPDEFETYYKKNYGK